MIDRVSSMIANQAEKLGFHTGREKALPTSEQKDQTPVDRTDISGGSAAKKGSAKKGSSSPPVSKDSTSHEPVSQKSTPAGDVTAAARKRGAEAPTLLQEEQALTGLPSLSSPAANLFDLKPFDRTMLTTGKPFRGSEAYLIEMVSGAPLTEGGLTRVYADCVPGARVCIPGVRLVGNNCFDYTVSWMDNKGQEVSHLERRIIRHENGSVELHSFNVWVAQEYRGRGISATAMLNEIKMLKSLSDHPDTRLSLRAGHAFSKWTSMEKLGTYTWANFGYGFADSDGPIENFMGYPERCPGDDRTLSSRELLQKKFAEWIDIQEKKGTINPALTKDIIDVSKEWQYPWQFSTFQLPGVKIPCTIGENTVPCDIGKAFLTSEEAPVWDGAWYVNRQEPDLQDVGLKYCRKTLDGAEKAMGADREKLTTALLSNDRNAKLKAIETIGIQGNKDWILPLLSAQGPGAGLSEAIDTAVDRLKGNELARDLRATVLDREQPIKGRVSALQRLRNITGDTQLPLFQSLLKEPGDEARLEAFGALYWGEWYENQGMVLNEALKLLPRIPPEEGNMERKALRQFVLPALIFSNNQNLMQMALDAVEPRKEPDLVNLLHTFLNALNTPLATEYSTLLSTKGAKS